MSTRCCTSNCQRFQLFQLSSFTTYFVPSSVTFLSSYQKRPPYSAYYHGEMEFTRGKRNYTCKEESNNSQWKWRSTWENPQPVVWKFRSLHHNQDWEVNTKYLPARADCTAGNDCTASYTKAVLYSNRAWEANLNPLPFRDTTSNVSTKFSLFSPHSPDKFSQVSNYLGIAASNGWRIEKEEKKSIIGTDEVPLGLYPAWFMPRAEFLLACTRFLNLTICIPLDAVHFVNCTDGKHHKPGVGPMQDLVGIDLRTPRKQGRRPAVKGRGVWL